MAFNVCGIKIVFLMLISLFYSYLPSCLLNYVTIDNVCQCSCPLSYYFFFSLETFILLQVGFLLQCQAAVLLSAEKCWWEMIAADVERYGASRSRLRGWGTSSLGCVPTV